MGHLIKGYLCYKSELDKVGPHPRSLLNQVIKAEVRSKRRVMKDFPSLSQLHLAYLHVQLLADIQLENSFANANNVVEGAHTIVALIGQSDPPAICPLTHHWAALAAITLAEHMEKSKDGEATTAASRELRDRLSSTQIQHLYSHNGDAPAWDRVISAFLTTKLGPEHDNDRGGLEHLADAAVGKSKTAGNEPLQWTLQTSHGYLSVFD